MVQLIPVEDPSDPRLDPYRAMRERDLKGRDRRFVAEGKVVLDGLLSTNHFRTESLMLLESRLPGMEPVLRKAAAGLPVFVASPPVMDAVTGFPVHRGILGIGLRGSGGTVAALLSTLPQHALVVACVGICNHDNIGGIFRNAAAFGARAVLLDASCCDPLYRKAIRVSVGAALRIPFAVAASAEEITAALDVGGFQTLALSPHGETRLADVTRAPRAALLCGSEGPGLPLDLLARTQAVRIPIRPDWDSLNVATAAAIALSHLAGEAELT